MWAQGNGQVKGIGMRVAEYDGMTVPGDAQWKIQIGLQVGGLRRARGG